jgi:hypothetical protein
VARDLENGKESANQSEDERNEENDNDERKNDVIDSLNLFVRFFNLSLHLLNHAGLFCDFFGEVVLGKVVHHSAFSFTLFADRLKVKKIKGGFDNLNQGLI